MNFSNVIKGHTLPTSGPLSLLNRAKATSTANGPDQPELPAKINPASSGETRLCPQCHYKLSDSDPQYSRWKVCDKCGHHFVMTAASRLTTLLDANSFRPIGPHLLPVDFLDFSDERPYKTRLALMQQKTGLSDAIVTGRGTIGGQAVVMAVLDFNFMGGSMGSVVGEQVVHAFEYALRHHLPVVTVANSGGARMQEGIVSLMQLAKTAAAVGKFQQAGLFFVSILANPTTGGVFASFASLGDVVVAEPKALIGFAGPRVVEQTTGQKLPPESHTAEFLREHGFVDEIVARPELQSYLAQLLQLVLTRHPQKATEPTRPDSHQPPTLTNAAPPIDATSTAAIQPPSSETTALAPTAWERVQLSRHPQRPKASEYIRQLSPDFIELHGDQLFGDDPAIIIGLGQLEGRKVVWIGQERDHLNPDGTLLEDHHQAKARPEGYRKALRAMRLAARLGWPLLTLVDTPGANPDFESETRGLASSLAHCLTEMSSLPIPTVAILIGEGGSGGALALAVADRVLMLENSIYSVIGPEGAAAILYRDARLASTVASAIKLTAQDCLELGVIDRIVPEPPGGAQTNPASALQLLRLDLLRSLAQIEKLSVRKRLALRYRKYRRMGQFAKPTHDQRHGQPRSENPAEAFSA